MIHREIRSPAPRLALVTLLILLAATVAMSTAVSAHCDQEGLVNVLLRCDGHCHEDGLVNLGCTPSPGTCPGGVDRVTGGHCI